MIDNGRLSWKERTAGIRSISIGEWKQPFLFTEKVLKFSYSHFLEKSLFTDSSPLSYPVSIVF